MAKILIVDVDSSVRLFLHKMLTHFDHEVTGMATNCYEALQVAKIIHPDLVLMNVASPSAEDTVEAAGKIDLELGIPVILIADEDRHEPVEEANSPLPFAWLNSAWREEDLKAAMEQSLRRKARQKGPHESVNADRHAAANGSHMQDCRMVEENIESRMLGEITEKSCRIVHPDGSIRWIEDFAFPIAARNEVVASIAGSAEDT